MNSNDWKTTLVGVLTGSAVILNEAYQSLVAGHPVQWGLVCMGIGLMVLGKLTAAIAPKQAVLKPEVAAMVELAVEAMQSSATAQDVANAAQRRAERAIEDLHPPTSVASVSAVLPPPVLTPRTSGTSPGGSSQP
jgi:hypothetical protein